MGDALFAVRNNFYLGAFQTAISEASQLTGLSEAEKIERDVFVYRSYIELGSHEVGDSLRRAVCKLVPAPWQPPVRRPCRRCFWSLGFRPDRRLCTWLAPCTLCSW